VPPTYAAVYALGVTAPQLFGDPDLKLDFGRLVHAGQEFTWERHPEVGETVTARGRVVSDIERRGMRFLTFATDCSDAQGRSLCSSEALFVIRP